MPSHQKNKNKIEQHIKQDITTHITTCFVQSFRTTAIRWLYSWLLVSVSVSSRISLSGWMLEIWGWAWARFMAIQTLGSYWENMGKLWWAIGFWSTMEYRCSDKPTFKKFWCTAQRGGRLGARVNLCSVPVQVEVFALNTLVTQPPLHGESNVAGKRYEAINND